MENIILFIILFLLFIYITYLFIKGYKEYRDEKRKYREIVDEWVKIIKDEYEFRQMLEKSKEWENENRK